MDQLAQLRVALEKAEAKVKRLVAQADAAQKERDELETAIRVIERFSSAGNGAPAQNQQSDNGQLIFGYVGAGPENAKVPKEIIDALRADGHDLGDDLVRTQLWRMAKRNELRKDDGRYWRPVTPRERDERRNPFADDDDPFESPSGRTSLREQLIDRAPQPPSRRDPFDASDLEDDVPF